MKQAYLVQVVLQCAKSDPFRLTFMVQRGCVKTVVLVGRLAKPPQLKAWQLSVTYRSTHTTPYPYKR